MLQAGYTAARATSSDLAAAQALAQLRHEEQVNEDDCMESGEEMAEEEEWRGGSSGAGYDRGFRLTAPPVPLWLPGSVTCFHTCSGSSVCSVHAIICGCLVPSCIC